MARYAVFSTYGAWDPNFAGFVGLCDRDKWREYIDNDRKERYTSSDTIHYEGGYTDETWEHLGNMEVHIHSRIEFEKVIVIGVTFDSADMYFFVPIDEE